MINIFDSDIKAINQIANHYGLEKQLDQTVEECSELIQAIMKWKRGDDSDVLGLIYDVAEEIADVWIMLNQLTELDDDIADAVDEDIRFKLDRQLERILKEK
ncbi:MAG: hypothetical protein ACI3VR_00610 [Intestinibacter sp.]|uniref:hypothetical protein n=1 Tax=Intestinibacter sp. TaxID=1965304 RepID=UPI003F187174